MITAINLIKRFLFDLTHALYFAALDLDEELQRTKTNGQRVTIWIGIFILIAILIYAALYGIWYLLDSTDTSGIQI
ncbi:hypothetical protein KBD81_02970 [Candidatus Woesebacteria bacterium]|nr:hypothetical protein [Candidatus Woesebacteria bacterium]